MNLFANVLNMTFPVFVWNIRLKIHTHKRITSFFFCLFSFEARVSHKPNVAHTRNSGPYEAMTLRRFNEPFLRSKKDLKIKFVYRANDIHIDTHAMCVCIRDAQRQPPVRVYAFAHRIGTVMGQQHNLLAVRLEIGMSSTFS